MSLAPEQSSLAFETLNVHMDDGVRFAEILAPPMNLLGPDARDPG
ncbi:MAG TPA: hypothetical protein VIX82_01025 [Solirubrobacteraceae bacterium]